MRAPEFWHNPPARPGLLSTALIPFGWLYALATRRRVQRPADYEAACPVICVGNLNAGGTGKTPTVIALAEKLGDGAHVVSKGYGGSLAGPVRVDQHGHTADDVGDEPLLISSFAPVWVAKDRAAGVRAAEESGAKAILLDDGLQDPSVRKSLSIVVVSAPAGFGNGRVIPAGPLREQVAEGLKRADLLLVIGEESEQSAFDTIWGDAMTTPILRARLSPLPTGMDWDGARVMPFAGIGQPEKFFETLRRLGAEVVSPVPLDDHQPLTDTLMARLERQAANLGAHLATTEKDAARLPPSYRAKVLALPVRLTLTSSDILDEALAAAGIGNLK
ncbi:MAG: tetraacyldisaccharide 4'-kinase [Paracoccaceae bacterium]|nr:tetraacyldisaccharide 4'-kinase [Paracoccaceae bacterium]